MGTPFYAAYERPDVSARPHQDAARYAPQGERPFAGVRVGRQRGRRNTTGIHTGRIADGRTRGMGGMEPTEVTWLTAYDAYYYDRTGGAASAGAPRQVRRSGRHMAVP